MTGRARIVSRYEVEGEPVLLTVVLTAEGDDCPSGTLEWRPASNVAQSYKVGMIFNVEFQAVNIQS